MSFAMRVSLLVMVGAALVGAGPAVGDQAEGKPGAPRLAAARIAAGNFHTCALLSNGTVRCWGNGARGQLGYANATVIGDDPNETPDTVGPVDLGAGRTAVAITAGGAHTCAVLDNGDVRCWGDNGVGQLGYGNTIRVGDTETPGSVGPVNLGPGRTAIAIGAGTDHTCAVLDNGDVRCWGLGGAGRLGYGNETTIGNDPGETPDTVGPVDLGAGRTAVAITAGVAHTCAVLDNGDVRCWGGGGSGRLGYGSIEAIGDTETPGSVGPVDLGAGRTAVAIAAGAEHTCAVLDNGDTRCWGEAEVGQLGYGSTEDIGDEANETPGDIGPVNLGANRTAVAITAGEDHTCGVLDTGAVRCWGAGVFGELGYGPAPIVVGDQPNETPANFGPVNLGAGRTALAITAGPVHTCAVLDNGTVRCWGEGDLGRLGYGSTDDIGDNETPDAAGPVRLGGSLLPSPPSPPSSPPPAQQGSCLGLSATITGTSGADSLVGTPGNDVIATLDGNDVVDGGGGDDLVCGGNGDDALAGGPGNDRLLGDAGNDTLRGGPGTKDLCKGGAGNRDRAKKCEKVRQVP